MESKQINVIYPILSSCKTQMTNSINRPMFKFCVFINPIMYGLLLGLMYRNRSINDFVNYALLGSGLLSIWGTICFSSISDIQRERWYGTLEILYVSPSGFRNVILGKILGNTFWGLGSMILSTLFVTIFFRIGIKVENISLLFLGSIALIFSYISIAFLFSSIFTLSRNARTFMNILEHPINILSGILFPIALLPYPLRAISYILTPYWSAELIRSIINNDTTIFLYNFSFLIIVSIVYYIIGIYLFRRIDVQARMKGTLGLY